MMYGRGDGGGLAAGRDQIEHQNTSGSVAYEYFSRRLIKQMVTMIAIRPVPGVQLRCPVLRY